MFESKVMVSLRKLVKGSAVHLSYQQRIRRYYILMLKSAQLILTTLDRGQHRLRQ